ncbi:MAG: hypothetical protein AseanaTS_18400 [Candidatus Pelagadaptatus aseana]|uniref:hypothetical protein n=1 Tax=Candidatus Pelagadaptatus aseana TaxID=3120508 RepID=UPI0039B2B0D8
MEDRAAVLIFEQDKLSREMRYSEFEAILDNYAPMPELAGTKVKAVYVQIDDALKVKALVFFTISFDAEGFADHRWNIPLQQLAENSARGPDMGSGAIRLACRSQCCIEWHQPNLWDPEMGSKSTHFHAIRDAINDNRLGFVAEQEPDDIPILEGQAVTSGVTQAINTEALELLKKEHHLRLSAMLESHEQALQKLKSKFQSNLKDARSDREQLEQQLQQEQAKNEELKQTIDGQAGKIQGLREYFENKLATAVSSGEESLEDLRKAYEAEIDARVNASTASLKEEVQLKEVSLMYKETQCSGLEEELKRLQQEKQELLANSGNQLLERLHKASISFVSFQPGYGHLTLPVDDIPLFMEDSEAYVAEKCGVDKHLYRSWLHHYGNPSCQAIADGGLPCGRRIPRVERPADYLMGESDRCESHGRQGQD